MATLLYRLVLDPGNGSDVKQSFKTEPTLWLGVCRYYQYITRYTYIFSVPNGVD